MMTLISMGQGNPYALKRTLDSMKPYCNEVIFGNLCIFPDDSLVMSSYAQDYNLKNYIYPFNFIFKNGFSAILNDLAAQASNDIVIYMNLSEVIETPLAMDVIKHGITGGWNNTWYFNHATDPHHWFRTYDRRQLHWEGLIHETLQGRRKEYPSPIFTMADTEKDVHNPFRTAVYNDIKELVYFRQYLNLVEFPETIGPTDPGWVAYAKDGYESLKSRLEKKGMRYRAFKEGNIDMYLQDIFTNPEFEKERFESSELINFQGDRKLL